MTGKLEAAFAAIDDANREDASCLAYGQRMTAVLGELEPSPTDALAIAVRAQHIRRFEVPRSSYPAGLIGYKKWRAKLLRFHAELAAQIARDVGYPEETAKRIAEIVRKQRLATDPEVQILEDAACIVFVRFGLETFADSHPRDKVVSVIAKTLSKMSERGRALASSAALPPPLLEMIQEASSMVT